MQTIIVILSGVSFSLEHRAYEQLKAFIDKISLHYSGYSNQRAILIEVERRIASYFTTNRLPDSDIINESLVQNAIDSLGNSVYSFENVTADQQPIYNSVTNTSEPLSGSKLYRDTNSAIIGGVCSGLAQYLKTDKIIVRLLFVVFFIVSSGLVLLVYIILWIGMGKKSNILPPPASAGENNDLSGQRNFSQNLSGSASSENRYSQNVATEKPVKPSSFNKVIGFLLFAFGILNLAALITGFVFLSEVVDKLPQVFHPLAQDGFFNHFFSQTSSSTMVISALVVLGLPLLLLIYLGSRLMFNISTSGRPVVLSALAVWFIAIVVAISSVIGAVNVFSTSATASETNSLAFASDTIYIKLATDDNFEKKPKVSMNHIMVVDDNGVEKIVGKAKFTVEKSDGNYSELIVNRYAKGNNYRSAKTNADRIEYDYSVAGDTLFLRQFFTLQKSDKWRSQRVDLTMKLPTETVIFFHQSLLPIVCSIENQQNMWEGDMLDKYWEMSDNGLTLIK